MYPQQHALLIPTVIQQNASTAYLMEFVALMTLSIVTTTYVELVTVIVTLEHVLQEQLADAIIFLIFIHFWQTVVYPKQKFVFQVKRKSNTHKSENIQNLNDTWNITI